MRYGPPADATPNGYTAVTMNPVPPLTEEIFYGNC